ncbi:MAG: hypothetical protein B7Z15_03745 [Rhizobiales bacterium 32-66-8]|nr:MAG: hypothetical protein B7Z15_03745 [Rhizobiales bacterium 32-66-8]
MPAPAAPAPPPATPVAAAPRTDAQQAYAAADRGYKAYAAKDYPAAIAAARTAVAAEPSNAGYRLLLVNALSAANRLTEATQAAGEALARLPGNAELLAQRGYAFQRLGRATQAAQDFSAALRTGRISAQEARGLRLALADTALAAKTPEQALAALAPLARDTGYEVQARRGFALQALNRHDEALVAFERAAASAPSAADRATMTRAGIGELVALGRKAEAKDRFLAALDAGDLRTLSDVDTAYLANQVGADPQAYAYFQKAQAYGGLRGSALLDAGYVAKREVHNPEAVALFKSAIDANRDGELPLPPQTVFGLRREVADMERVWGVYASVSYGAVGVMPTSPLAPPPGVGNTVQAGTELYWRPPVIGYRNGALVEMFFRAFETIYDDNGGATGVDTIQGSVGARWKPLSDQNLVLEASYLFPIGNLARTDWLFLGRSYRADPISDRVVFTPFLAIGGAYDSTLATPGALGAGPGANLRFWFREDRYTAPQSYVDLTLQYRWRLAGDERAEGIFASAFLSY